MLPSLDIHSIESYDDPLSRKQKLSGRDAARVLFEYAEKRRASDQSLHETHYAALSALPSSSNWSALLHTPTEVDNIVTALTAKLEFMCDTIVLKILSECKHFLSVACVEQGDLMGKMINQIQRTVELVQNGLKALHVTVKTVMTEKNNFASKALSLAKSIRSVCYHEIESAMINPSLEFCTLISDISLKRKVGTERAVKRLYASLQEDTKSSCSERVDSVETSDMLNYIETIYSSRLMTMLIDDVKKVVNKLVEEDSAAMAAKEKSEIKRAATYESSATRQSVLIAKERVMKAEKESAAFLMMRRRDGAAISIQCCYRRYMHRKMTVKRLHDILAARVARFVRIGCFRRKLCRIITHKRRVKMATALIQRVCWRHIKNMQRKQWAADVISRNVKKLFRRYKYRHMALLVKSLASAHVQNAWMCKWQGLEDRIISPVSVAQHYLSRSEIERSLSKGLNSENNDVKQKDRYHERLVMMSKWKEFRPKEIPHSDSNGCSFFLNSNVPNEAISGFGRGNASELSVVRAEDSCTVYSIIGASVIRLGETSPETCNPVQPNSSVHHKRNTLVASRKMKHNSFRPPRATIHSAVFAGVEHEDPATSTTNSTEVPRPLSPPSSTIVRRSRYTKRGRRITTRRRNSPENSELCSEEAAEENKPCQYSSAANATSQSTNCSMDKVSALPLAPNYSSNTESKGRGEPKPDKLASETRISVTLPTPNEDSQSCDSSVENGAPILPLQHELMQIRERLRQYMRDGIS